MSSNPRLGDEVGKGQREKVFEGFLKDTGIPETLLVEDPLIGRWRVERLPKPGNTRIQRFKVYDCTSGVVVWIGRKIEVANRIRERLTGWQEALHFPPEGKK